MKRNKVFLVLLISATLLVVSGCLVYEERIVLNKDGSGTMNVHYFTDKDINIHGDYGKYTGDEDEIYREVKRKYTSKNVKLTQFEVREKGDDRHVYFTLSFKDAAHLNELKQFDDSHIELKHLSHGKLRFERELEIDGDWEEEEEKDSYLGALIKSIVEETFLRKIKFRFEVTLPNKIGETNAHWIRGEKNAVWKYRLSDLMKEGKVKMRVSGE